MRTVSTILTAAAFLVHVWLGCGCQHPRAHDAEAGHALGLHVCGGHHHHSSGPVVEHAVTHDGGNSHQPCESRQCQCGHVGCVYVVGSKVKPTSDPGALFALVESVATLPGPDVGRTGFEARSGPPPSLRSHLLLQILLV